MKGLICSSNLFVNSPSIIPWPINGKSLRKSKSKSGEICQLASQEAIQMHGGVGMTDEYDIGFFLKRSRVADAFLGNSKFHINQFAVLRGY